MIRFRHALAAVLGARVGWRLTFYILLGMVSYLALSPQPPHGFDTGWDKLNHAGAFSVLTVAALLSHTRSRWTLWIVCAAMLAFGGAIELMQLYVPGRESERADLLADAIGVAGGMVFWRALEWAAATLDTQR